MASYARGDASSPAAGRFGPSAVEVNCRTIEQMRLANALCRFVELADSAPMPL
jgi:hypothetical protein